MISKPTPLSTVLRCPNCKHEMVRRAPWLNETPIQCSKCKKIFQALEFEIFTLKWVKQG